jgi:ribonuclease HI
MTDKIIIYTDGGCTGNPGPGGWAAVILSAADDAVELAGGEDSTTNNRMELTAVIRALENVLDTFGTGRQIEVHTDSQYVQKGISTWMKGWLAKGWKTAGGGPVKNKDLWLILKSLDDSLNVTWKWVRGHAGNLWNERCDQLVAAQRELFS